MRQKLHRRQSSAATEVNGFGFASDGIDHLHIVIKGHPLLREVAEAHGFPDDEAPCVGLFQA